MADIRRRVGVGVRSAGAVAQKRPHDPWLIAILRSPRQAARVFLVARFYCRSWFAALPRSDLATLISAVSKADLRQLPDAGSSCSTCETGTDYKRCPGISAEAGLQVRTPGSARFKARDRVLYEPAVPDAAAPSRVRRTSSTNHSNRCRDPGRSGRRGNLRACQNSLPARRESHFRRRWVPCAIALCSKPRRRVPLSGPDEARDRFRRGHASSPSLATWS